MTNMNQPATRGRSVGDFHFGADYTLPDVEASPKLLESLGARGSSEHNQKLRSQRRGEVIVAIDLPIRKSQKVIKHILIDENIELRHAEIANWNKNYIENMVTHRKKKEVYRTLLQAKKNASFWVSGVGLGGVGKGVGSCKMINPALDMFYGERLMTMFGRGSTNVVSKGQKRNLDSEDDTLTPRNTRLRLSSEDHIGRGDDYDLPNFNDDGTEIGRNAEAAMEDPSSAMPWNISGRDPSSALGFPTSAGGNSGRDGSAGPGFLPHRIIRNISASPLHGRVRLSGRLSSLEVEERDESKTEDDINIFLDEDLGIDGGLNSFEYFGAGATLETQNTQAIISALDRESYNFFDFFKAGIRKKAAHSNEKGKGRADAIITERHGAREMCVLFEELVPYEHNSAIVAAQAMHHTLLLATRGLMMLQQDEHFGDIQMAIVDDLDLHMEAMV
jgi:meiotic recombination protein REC8, fungi type